MNQTLISQTVISMFLHIIVVKVWTFILMNFSWNVIPLLCLYVNISLDELFFELAQDYSREEEPPDSGEWVWGGFIVVSNFLLFRIVWCQEIYPWARLCSPPPPPQELHFLGVGVYRQSLMKWGYGHVLCDHTLWRTCSVLMRKSRQEPLHRKFLIVSTKNTEIIHLQNTEATHSFKKEKVI